MNEKMTRDGVEKLLWEATGFRGDATQMDALMLALEAWAVDMAGGLSTASPALREGHEHLVVQMGELILDSGGRLAAMQRLADTVEKLSAERGGDLAARVDALGVQVQTLTQTVLASRPEPLLTTYTAPAMEWTPQMAEEFKSGRDGLRDTPARVARAYAEVMEKLADPEPETVLPESTRAVVKARLHPATRDKIQCRACGREKKPAEFFKNSKSPTGYETRCRECRGRPGKAAAA